MKKSKTSTRRAAYHGGGLRHQRSREPCPSSPTIDPLEAAMPHARPARRRREGCGSARRGRGRSRSRSGWGSRSRRSASAGRPCAARSGFVSSAQTSSVAGFARAEAAQQVLERQPGVDDVLDDQHVAVLDRGVEILEDAHDPGGVGRRAVGGDRHEIDLHRDLDQAHQVGEEEHRALQHPHQQQRRRCRVVARDLLAELGHAQAQRSASTSISPTRQRGLERHSGVRRHGSDGGRDALRRQDGHAGSVGAGARSAPGTWWRLI